MRSWFELGMKIGCIELAAKLCNLPHMQISPHDIEDVHYEILNYINEMGLDSSKIADAKIDDYSNLALDLITSPCRSNKRQLFLLGYYMVKLKMLLVNDLDDVFNEQRDELYGYVCKKIDELKLSKSLKKISLEEFRESDFDNIEESIKNDSNFDIENDLEYSIAKNDKSNKWYNWPITIAIVGALAAIIAAIITTLFSNN